MLHAAWKIVIAVVVANICYAEGTQEGLHVQNRSRVEPRNLLGIRSAKYSGYLYINPHPRAGPKRNAAAFHIVIPTTGWRSIF
ncbi:g8654 [Coccomyxa viridis]|uniref:G8654 protein n=1 Tax=Coccomyxa viridis TaxID=1274662 RepID=A0ABP1G110_9CHLO